LSLYIFRLAAELATCLLSPTPRDPILLDIKGKCYPAKNDRTKFGNSRPGAAIAYADWKISAGHGLVWFNAMQEYGL
jgi:hypothetical protein